MKIFEDTLLRDVFFLRTCKSIYIPRIYSVLYTLSQNKPYAKLLKKINVTKTFFLGGGGELHPSVLFLIGDSQVSSL